MNIVSAKVIKSSGHDTVILDTDDLPSPVPAVTNQNLQLIFHAERDKGREYVVNNFGFEPTVIERF